MLENFQRIIVEKPVDKIIKQIRALIISGELKPGDKLPPERRLAEKFGVSRGPVREAIQKLEFYGILKTQPQSGTVVAGLGISAIEGLISDVLLLEPTDFRSLVEMRLILEVNAAKLAAQRRSTDDIIAIQNALQSYEDKIAQNNPAVEEDLLFHLKIAEASKNRALKSFMLIITPDIVSNYIALKVCSDAEFNKTIQEHRLIVNSIIDQDQQKSGDSMRLHLNDVVIYSKSHVLGNGQTNKSL